MGLPVVKVGQPMRSWNQCLKSAWIAHAECAAAAHTVAKGGTAGVVNATACAHAAEAAADADVANSDHLFSGPCLASCCGCDGKSPCELLQKDMPCG